ncbi:hypothetical protein LEP1GSC088_0485 [Leptospira interrogans str. L1207]|nr:hypothetical protein LEP1GSC088_0485 [Leptospira interrogans str. L1207]
MKKVQMASNANKILSKVKNLKTKLTKRMKKDYKTLWK